MRESTAWRILAKRFDARRARSPYLCNALGKNGVVPCPAVAKIPAELRAKMVTRIVEALRPAYVAYASGEWFGLFISPAEARAGRVLACLMFAEIARDEERAS